MRLPGAAFAAMAVALVLAASAEEGRGPSTREEREKVLLLVRGLEEEPLAESAKGDREWLTLWLVEVPDVKVSLCTVFFPSLLGVKEKHASDLVMQSAFSMAAFIIRHPERAGDDAAKYQAGVEGMLKAYEAILKKKPEARWVVLDELLARRDSGDLPDFIRDTASQCKTS